jgi:hypothetical protein
MFHGVQYQESVPAAVDEKEFSVKEMDVPVELLPQEVEEPGVAVGASVVHFSSETFFLQTPDPIDAPLVESA